MSKGSMPPIQQLPDEMLVEVLRYLLGDDIPSQDDAIVCQRWTKLLLETGTFWRKTRAEFISADRVLSLASRLRRRLELSREVLLDVTLDVSGFRDSSSSILFEILGAVNVHRWRSLTLEKFGRHLPFNCMAGYFKGTFAALQSLFLEEIVGDDPYRPIYDLLVFSPTRLKKIYTRRPIPALLRNPAVIAKVVDLTIPAQLYAEAYKSMAIEAVYLTNSHNANFSLLPPLPKRVKIDVVSGNQLAELNLVNVRSLDIRYYVAADTCRIRLPSLISLILPKSIRYVAYFDTPSLVSLGLGDDNLWGTEKQKESRKIIKLFTGDRHQISMAPTSLEMYLSITTAAAIAALSHWPQIRYLSLDLTCGDRFAWQGGFSKALTTSPNTMCPNLVTLKLRTLWDTCESNKWQLKASEMFKARCSGPLDVISWTHNGDEGEIILLRQDFE